MRITPLDLLAYADYKRPLSESDSKSIRDIAQALITEFPKASFEGRADIIDPKVWADESWKLGVLYTYANGSPPFCDFSHQIQEHLAMDLPFQRIT